jgi:DNA-binding NarL/FixJ family response regulator
MSWTKKEIEDVKRRLADGENTAQIAESLKIPTGEFYRLCFTYDISIRAIRGLAKPAPSITDSVKHKIREAAIKAHKEEVAKNSRRKVDRASRIIEMRRNGATYLEIGEKYDMTPEGVRYIIKKYNETADEPLPLKEFNHKRPPSQIVAARREKVAELRRRGLSHRQIAKEMKVSLGVIRQDLEFYNRASDDPVPRFVVHKQQRIDNKAKVEIVRLRNFGVPVTEIAEKFNVIPSRIYQILNGDVRRDR